MRRILIGSLLALLVVPATAQKNPGTVEGTVVDMAGAVFSDVTVLLINLRTLETVKVRSAVNGTFRFDGIRPGRYEVIASDVKSNCFASKPKKIKVKAGQTLKLSIKLELDRECKVVSSD